MSKKRNNPHKNFMILNGVLVIAVFIVVLLFLYISFKFKRDADKARFYEGKYEIEITPDLIGQDIRLYINDSLLMEQAMPDSTVKITINKFAEENILMIVDNHTDNVTSFNLSPDGSKVTIKKAEDAISIIEQKDVH
jgi:hypothetical protein